jgi:hypothetical protein
VRARALAAGARMRGPQRRERIVRLARRADIVAIVESVMTACRQIDQQLIVVIFVIVGSGRELLRVHGGSWTK